MTTTSTTADCRQEYAEKLSTYNQAYAAYCNRDAADEPQAGEDPLFEALTEAEKELFACPAPTLSDLVDKFHIADVDRTLAGLLMPGQFQNMMDDLKRFAGKPAFEPSEWLDQWTAADGAYLVQDGEVKLCCAIQKVSQTRQGLINQLDHGDNRQRVAAYIVEQSA